MEIAFILVEPRVPDNIGAAARAIDNMGFSDLRLVRPKNHKDERAGWVACHSKDILENAKIYDTFEEATADRDFNIATTAKGRSLSHEFKSSTEVADFMIQKTGHVSKIGLIFGREDNGLDNVELSKCDLVSSIPTNKNYGAINLAQALMIYAYELSKINRLDISHLMKDKEKSLDYKVFKEKIVELCHLIDINPNTVRTRRIFEKLSHINDDDIRLIHYFRKKILRKVDAENWRRGR